MKILGNLGVAIALIILAVGCVSESRKVYDERLLTASCKSCENIDGFVPPSEISEVVRRMVGKYKGRGRGMRKSKRKGKDRRRGSGRSGNVAIQEARGVIETYLEPSFIDGGKCPEIDSEKWAIDYSYKRRRPALHKGIDIPERRGTPI